MTLRNKGIAAMKWSSIAAVTITVSQLLQFVLVSRILGPADYGLIGMITAILYISIGFCDLGFANAIIQRQQISDEHLSSLYILNLIISGVVCVAVWLLAPWIAAFYHEPQLVGLLHWMAFICFIPAIGQQFQVLFQKELNFDVTSKADMAANVISFVVAVAFAYAGFGVFALAWSFLANLLAKSAIMVVLGLRIWKPSLHFAWSDVKSYVSFGIYQTGTSVINMVNARLDYLILGSSLGAEALGYYMFACQLCQIPLQKLNPMVFQVTLPIFAKIQTQVELLRKGYMQMLGMISYVSAPIFFGIIVTAPAFVPLVFGEQWEPSILIIQILSLVMFLQGVTTSASLLAAIGQVDVTFRFTVISTLIQFPAMALGAFMDGAIGMTVAYLLVRVGLYFFHYSYIIRRILGPCLRRYIAGVLEGTLYSAAMAAGVFLADRYLKFHSQPVRLSVLVCGGVLAYAAILYGFKRELFHRMIKNRLPNRELRKSA